MINEQRWETINACIEKGYIIKNGIGDIFKLKYKENCIEDLDIMLGFQVNSVGNKKGVLYCQSEWTCDGDIFEKKTNKLLAKNLTKPKNYRSPCINELHPEIKTHPFSASLKIEGIPGVTYQHTDGFHKTFDCAPSKIIKNSNGKTTKLKLDNINPDYALHYVIPQKGDFVYIVGITNRKTEMELSDNLFVFVVDSLLEQSLPEGVTDTDFTGTRRPETFSFRTFDQALDWVNENKKTLILKYNNGFKLELAPESQWKSQFDNKPNLTSIQSGVYGTTNTQTLLDD